MYIVKKKQALQLFLAIVLVTLESLLESLPGAGRINFEIAPKEVVMSVTSGLEIISRNHLPWPDVAHTPHGKPMDEIEFELACTAQPNNGVTLEPSQASIAGSVTSGLEIISGNDRAEILQPATEPALLAGLNTRIAGTRPSF